MLLGKATRMFAIPTHGKSRYVAQVGKCLMKICVFTAMFYFRQPERFTSHIGPAFSLPQSSEHSKKNGK